MNSLIFFDKFNFFTFFKLPLENIQDLKWSVSFIKFLKKIKDVILKIDTNSKK